MEQFSCVAVHRDREWFQEVLPKITAFWHEVTYYRSLDPAQLFRDYNKTMPTTIDYVDEGGNDGNDAPVFLSETESDNGDMPPLAIRPKREIPENAFLPESDDE